MTDELRTKFDLLPCPFCGNTEDDFEGSPWPRNREMTSWIVRCGNPSCNAEVIDESPEMAASRWNRRASRDAEVETLKLDAERYRWLRRKVAIIGKDGLLGEAADRYCVFEFCNLPFPTYIAPDPSIELDAAIDAAMREGK